MKKKECFYDSNGNPISNGKVYVCEVGTEIKKTVYSDSNKLAVLDNPFVLDKDGGIKNEIWIDGDYKIVVKNVKSKTVYTLDNINKGASEGKPEFYITNKQPVPIYLIVLIILLVIETVALLFK